MGHTGVPVNKKQGFLEVGLILLAFYFYFLVFLFSVLIVPKAKLLYRKGLVGFLL